MGDGLLAVSSDASSVKSTRSSKSTQSRISSNSKGKKSPSTAATSLDINLDAQMSKLSLADGDDARDSSRIRVVYVTEQISHHPPVSAYFASCPTRSLELSGVDQISAKVATTTIRVSPGVFNRGIFVNITGGPGKGEKYHMTHPVAFVNGILRGSFYLTVEDSSIITCSGGKDGEHYRSIIEYKEEVRLDPA
jgi:oxysterol-binding protein-related protein 9/10/11